MDKIYTQQFRDQDVETEYLEQVRRMEFWKEFMLALGYKNFAGVEFADIFKKDSPTLAANNNSAVFVTKAQTSLYRVTPKGTKLADTSPIANNQKIVLASDHLELSLRTEEKNAKEQYEILTVSNIQSSWKDENKGFAEMGALERAKAALLLAHTAKLMGWKHVKIPETSDALEKFYLQQACKIANLKYDMPDIDADTLEINTSLLNEKLPTMKAACTAAFNSIIANPNFYILTPEKENKEKPASASAKVTHNSLSEVENIFSEFSAPQPIVA